MRLTYCLASVVSSLLFNQCIIHVFWTLSSQTRNWGKNIKKKWKWIQFTSRIFNIRLLLIKSKKSKLSEERPLKQCLIWKISWLWRARSKWMSGVYKNGGEVHFLLEEREIWVEVQNPIWMQKMSAKNKSIHLFE